MTEKEHRCENMVKDESFRNFNFGGKLRRFSMRFKDGGWYFYNNETPGQLFVQCPYCHQRLWVRNEVTIE